MRQCILAVSTWQALKGIFERFMGLCLGGVDACPVPEACRLFLWITRKLGQTPITPTLPVNVSVFICPYLHPLIIF